MYISQKCTGSNTPVLPLLVFSINDRNKRLVNNMCTKLIKVEIKKIIIILHVKLMYFTASIFVTLQLHVCIMKEILYYLEKKISAKIAK